MTFRLLVCAAHLAVLLPFANAQSKPPTLDPTYGMPIPKRVRAPKHVVDASWIWAKQVSDNQTIYLRKTITLKSQPKKAALFLTADDSFVAYINGQEVGSTIVASGDFNVWQKVQAFDVTALLKSGRNVIAFKVHNDREAAGALARLSIDGKLVLKSDKSWKVSDTASNDWVSNHFNDRHWLPATEESPVGLGPWGESLQGWPEALARTPSYLHHLSLRPLKWAYAGDPDHLNWHSITEAIGRPSSSGGDWTVIYDFGKELTGRVLLKSSTKNLQIGTGESAGEVLNKPWITSQSGETPYTALRFASIKVPVAQTKLTADIEFDHLYYPVTYKGSFDCSDPLITQIWYTGAYTVHLCMQDNIWDAPKRDRQEWMGDVHVSGEVIDNVFGDQFLMKQTMDHLRQGTQGGKPATELPGSHINGIPGYSYVWIATLADFYRHHGDRAYLVAQHDLLISMLEYCRGDFDENGVFVNKHHGWLFTDWCPGFENDSPYARATAHMFLFKAVRDSVFLFNELGDAANATKYSKWGDQLQQSAQAQLVSENGVFSDRKQENAMALFSGVATSLQANRMFDSGIFKIDPAPSDIILTPYYGNYVLLGMAKVGRIQEGLDLTRYLWGSMIKDGATTFYENYEPFYEKKNFHSHLQWDKFNTRNDPAAEAAAGYHESLCHGWSAGPVNFLTEGVLGVQSTGAGFATCSISPRLGDLQWASGVVPTPHGDLKIRIDRNSVGMTLRLLIPKGVHAKVSLPVAIQTVDGRPASGSSIELGSGKHFVAG